MEILKISREEPPLSPSLKKAATVLKSDGVVALPTDTLYGVAALASSTEGIGKLYDLKRRDGNKPVAICVSNIADIHKYSKPTVTDAVLKALLPGSITVVFHRSDCLNKDLNPGVDLVGIRIPDYPAVVRLVELCGTPLALTSANISQAQSSLEIEEFKDTWSDLNLILDGGRIGTNSGSAESDDDRRGSTVVDLSKEGYYRLIREGTNSGKIIDILQDAGLTEVKDN